MTAGSARHRRHKVLVAALTACLPAAPLLASDPYQSLQTATQLSTILGSEAFCGLTYDQAAIQAYVDAAVAPDDLAFAGNLNLMTLGQRGMNDSMSPSQKTAHCAAVIKTARHYGFID